MNVYFLVEGTTERKVYPKWISHLIPGLERVSVPRDADHNNYFLISGFGFPNILNKRLRDSMADVNDSGNYDMLILVIDADDTTVNEKVAEVNKFVYDNDLKLSNGVLKIVVQKCCIETWFLGNKRIYSKSPASKECLRFAKHFDTSKNDPELMLKPDDYASTLSMYHYDYLRKMLSEKNVRYTKSNPIEVGKPYYIKELIDRVNGDPSSLSSMKILFELCANILQSINQ
ncbi:MAG: hypothetical protein ACUZ8E_02535 [Candidatus Anammoxibacter sp.]